MRDSHEIGATQIRAHHGGQCTRRGEDTIANDRLGGLSGAAKQDELSVQAVLLVDFCILGEPWDPLGCRKRRNAPDYFFKRLFLGERSMENKDYRRTEQPGGSSLHL